MTKRFQQIAHHLDPIVTIGEQGLTDNLAIEVNRALADHELIKVRISVASRDDHAPRDDHASRDDRARLGEALAARCDADIIQKIGKIIVLYRENPNPNVKLSNVQRYGA